MISVNGTNDVINYDTLMEYFAPSGSIQRLFYGEINPLDAEHTAICAGTVGRLSYARRGV